MLKTFFIIVLLGAAVTASAADSSKGKIAKCKDAKGEWHYGDTAAEECARSNVTVINDRGLRVKEITAPPTAAELKVREAQKAAEDEQHQKAADQKKRDDQLLATYGVEDDIALARERKFADLRAQISSIEATLTTLRATLRRMQLQAEQEKKTGKISAQTEANIAKTEDQVAKQEAAMAAREKDKEAVKARYDADLQRYREIKGVPASKAKAEAAQAATVPTSTPAAAPSAKNP